MNVKSPNTLIVQLLEPVEFIYKVKKAIFVKRLSSIVENIQNKEFEIHVIFKKINVNILQKSIMYNIKPSLFKNHAWSMKKSHLNIYQKKIYKLIFVKGTNNTS